MLDYAELVKALRNNAEHFMTTDYEWSNAMVHLLMDSADDIEELLAVCRDVAAFVIHYADDDEVSAEVLCRKLHKIGVVEKYGAWWALPEPPEEVE